LHARDFVAVSYTKVMIESVKGFNTDKYNRQNRKKMKSDIIFLRLKSCFYVARFSYFNFLEINLIQPLNPLG